MSKKTAEELTEELKEKALSYLKSYQSDMTILQTQREKSISQYMGEPYGDEEEGRSSVVMSDTFDTIETIMPFLMKVFYGGQDVAKFSGQGEGDEDGAKLLGELVNFFVQKRMNGFVLFHDWMKSALMSRISMVKYWYEKRTDSKTREYEGITDAELEALMNRPGVKIVKMETEELEPAEVGEDGYGEQVIVSPAVSRHDVTVEIAKEVSQPMAESLPPEEFIFDVKAKCVTDSPCFHKRRLHKTEILKKYKVTEADLTDEISRFENDTLYVERFRDLGGLSFFQDSDDHYYIYEAYIDDYSSGEKQPKMLVILGNKVVSQEDNTYGEPPFIELSPIRLPHRAVGLDLAMIVKDIQRIHTALVRAILDNIYYQNNAREAFDPSSVDIDQLIDSNRPGGKLPVKPGKDPRAVVFPLPVAPLAPQTYQMLETVSNIRQDRTGINKYVQGNDKGLNKTAFGVNALLNQALQRQELLARIFAETGVTKFFRKMAELSIDYMDKPQAVKLNGQWQSINPQDIDIDYDVNIDVGIGTGTKDVTVQQLQMMMQASLPLIPTGIVTPENIYNILKNIYEAMGFKSTEQFITEPMEAANGMAQQGIPGGPPQGAGLPPMSSGGINEAPTFGGVPHEPPPGAY